MIIEYVIIGLLLGVILGYFFCRIEKMKGDD